MRRGSCTRGRTSNSHSTSTMRPLETRRGNSSIKISYEKRRSHLDRIELGAEFVRDVSRRLRLRIRTKRPRLDASLYSEKENWSSLNSSSIFVAPADCERRSKQSDGMRTTMIGPNYRWRGRAQDVLVSLSSSLLSSRP